LAETRKLSDIDVNTLIDAGLVGKSDLVKILGNGTISAKVNIKAHAFSAKAREAIEAVQGTTEVIS
jgi:large subunit ribosomal protein L15